MLVSLKVNNYALIRSLEVTFHPGFNIITGETGAGKSVLLGALGLLTGKRADGSALTGEQKCVVEGEFMIPDSLRAFFESGDLDFQNPCVIRREILPGGKSRAFVNDTPANLSVLQELNQYLVDIHSQHEIFALADPEFRIAVTDSAAGCEAKSADFTTLFREFSRMESAYKEAHAAYERDRRDLDYLLFRLNELDEASPEPGEESRLEDELRALSHAEEIQSALYASVQGLDEAEESVNTLLKKAVQILRKVEGYHSDIAPLAERLESSLVEIRDVVAEIRDFSDRIEADPGRLEWLSQRIAMLQKLKKLHGVSEADELVSIRRDLRDRVEQIELGDENLHEQKAAMESKKKEMSDSAAELHELRKKGAEWLEKQINEHLTELNMPHAKFLIHVENIPDFLPSGSDRIHFLFSANPGSEPKELRKVASGGEMSRVMLAVKTVIAKLKKLPTLVFDEIDTGISGKTADLAGEMMRKLSTDAQVFAITHLPQIASKGNVHFKVLKEVKGNQTETSIIGLSEQERVEEIARMLSGDSLLPEAINNAKALLESVKDK